MVCLFVSFVCLGFLCGFGFWLCLVCFLLGLVWLVVLVLFFPVG